MHYIIPGKQAKKLPGTLGLHPLDTTKIKPPGLSGG